MKKAFYLASITLALSSVINCVNAQVTIGDLEMPVRGALLQTKTVDDATSAGQANADRGIGFPRVNLVRDSLLCPMYDLTTAQSLSAQVEAAHRGLMVYNMTEDETYNLQEGVYYWDGQAWCPLQKAPQKAIFTVNCATVEVFGEYAKGESLNSANMLKLEVNVTRPGYYTINATSSPDNGYFFELSGNFYSSETFTIMVPGAGQPHESSDHIGHKDHFTLHLSGDDGVCLFDIEVDNTDIPLHYSMNCAQTVVNGQYFEDEELGTNAAHGPQTLDVTLTVDPASYGAKAIIQTNEVDGFSFSGSAILTSSPQTITLVGKGNPRGLNDKIFTITSNSTLTTASCNVTVCMLIPKKRLLGIGAVNTGDNMPYYGYNPAVPPNNTTRPTVNRMLTDDNNFGWHQWSILKFAGFNNVGSYPAGNRPSPITNDDGRDMIALDMDDYRNLSAADWGAYLFGRRGYPRIDIVMIGFDGSADSDGFCRTSNTLDQQKADTLINWCKNYGGILMICSEVTASNGNFCTRFFGTTVTPTAGAGAGSHYTFGFNSENTPSEYKSDYATDSDPILNGPFEVIVGKQWGEDASITRYLVGLPMDEVIVYSSGREVGNTSRPANSVTCFRAKDYPFVFIGDAGFNSAESYYQSVVSSVCPFVLAPKVKNGRTYSNWPSYRRNFGSPSSIDVYNAVFTANAFAWCILKAEEWRREHK
jgi:hypothetical protein